MTRAGSGSISGAERRCGSPLVSMVVNRSCGRSRPTRSSGISSSDCRPESGYKAGWSIPEEIRFRTCGSAIPSPYTARSGYRFRALTDAQGRFVWASAPAEPVIFRVSEPAGFFLGDEGFVRLTASDEEAVIVLKPAIDVGFDVVDAETGKAITGFLIRTGRPEPGKTEIHWSEFDRKLNERTYSAKLDPSLARITSRSPPMAMGPRRSRLRRRPWSCGM